MVQDPVCDIPVTGSLCFVEVDWPLIKGLLTKEGIAFGFALTEHKHHAVELTVKAINSGYRQLIAVGGDGTLNESVHSQSTPPRRDRPDDL